MLTAAGLARTALRRGARTIAVPTLFAATLVATLAALCARAVAATTTIVDAAQGDLSQILIVYGPSIGTMYVAFLMIRAIVLRAADPDSEKTSGKPDKIAAWLRVGKRLAYTTSILGIVSAVIQVVAAHSPWTVILATAVAAAFKLITPGAGLLPFPTPGTLPVASTAPAAPASTT